MAIGQNLPGADDFIRSIGPVSNSVASAPAETGPNLYTNMKDIYDSGDVIDVSQPNSPLLDNWYLQKPYGFKFTDKLGEEHVCYLPISPSNISIVTHFATNIIPTMYGTIEEHSEQRYYDITITGTTGMSPRYYSPSGSGVRYDPERDSTIGRASFPIVSGIFGGFDGFGFLKRQMALVNNTLNKVANMISEDNGSTGVDLRKTGYAAFHNFYKFLLVYKKDVSGEFGRVSRRNIHPLKFVNYKDNNEYNVAVQGFLLNRSASEPLLYNYNITLRAYNLREADSAGQFSNEIDRKAELGLNGLQTSAFAAISGLFSEGKDAAGSAIGATKGFGIGK